MSSVSKPRVLLNHYRNWGVKTMFLYAILGTFGSVINYFYVPEVGALVYDSRTRLIRSHRSRGERITRSTRCTRRVSRRGRCERIELSSNRRGPRLIDETWERIGKHYGKADLYLCVSNGCIWKRVLKRFACSHAVALTSDAFRPITSNCV